MIQALAITKDIRFCKNLMNEIHVHNSNINIFAISTNKKETVTLFRNFEPDIIFFDKRVLKLYDLKFFEKYHNITILISPDTHERLLDKDTFQEIHAITGNNDVEERKRKVIQELEYIGYEFKYNGTHFLVDTILEMYVQYNNNMVDNLQSDIYPIVAKKYNKTVYNVKTSIGKATDCMYFNSNADKIIDYFNFPEDMKPTPKQVVFTIINKILE
ncbi:MAG: hypothetical protein HFJ50_05840 [Clostridia bacterium]|nr:hypothetical protein [Clostridia bacterium]